MANARLTDPDSILAATFDRHRPRRVARGQALLVLIVMLSVATMLLVYGSTTELARFIQGEQRTRIVLEQARQALIGRAVADATRPGSLPCPDTNGDGSADLFAGSACPSYIGRLPWRTLGIGDLRDEHGERLWYALSPNYRDHPAAPPLNSDSKGTLTVFSNSNATAITQQAVAVIFAAGLALPGQTRDALVELCAANGKTVARTGCATHYLDAAAGINNAAAAGPYIIARPGLHYNDGLSVIVAADFMPLVEQRVALELRNALLAYRTNSACACYPWADSGADGVSDIGANRGRIPTLSALPQNWGAGVLPSYFIANDWARVFHYAVARNALENSGALCTTCVDSTLSLDGAAGHDVFLLTSGYAGANRPSNNAADYFDDLENRNNDDRYATPISAGADRDRMHPILGATAGCAAQARALIDNAPCAAPGNAVRAVCNSARAALMPCTCSAAATTIVNAPCVHGLGAAVCDAAVTQLRTCTL